MPATNLPANLIAGVLGIIVIALILMGIKADAKGLRAALGTTQIALANMRQAAQARQTPHAPAYITSIVTAQTIVRVPTIRATALALGLIVAALPLALVSAQKHLVMRRPVALGQAS
jgi:hypothetical protein